MRNIISQKVRTFAGRILMCVSVLIAFPVLCQAGDTPAAPASKPFRFVVYGDTRDGHAVHRKLVALIMELKPDLVIQTGDLVHSGSDEHLWKIYDDITGEMRRKTRVYPARGNHDVGGPGYEARVTAPFTSGNKLYYSFDTENCHFISIDSLSPWMPGSEQYQWLEKDLAAHKKAQHLIAFFHYPPYSIGAHGSDEHIRKALCPLFNKYGVRVVFNGHDHLYYRTQRSGIMYVVSGGGGAPLYPADPGKGAIEGDQWESANHIVLCEVDGPKIRVTALYPDGKTLDFFTLVAPELPKENP